MLAAAAAKGKPAFVLCDEKKKKFRLCPWGQHVPRGGFFPLHSSQPNSVLRRETRDAVEGSLLLCFAINFIKTFMFFRERITEHPGSFTTFS